MMTKCSICTEEIDKQYTPEGEMYWDKGHNAHPINNGQCCSNCNDTVVLPRRMEIAVLNNLDKLCKETPTNERNNTDSKL